MPLEHSGVVTGVADGILGVRIARARSCVSCSGYSVCGNQLLNGNSTSDFLLPVQKAERFRKGSRVSIEMPTEGFGRLTLLCYLVPALLMVGGAWVGSILTGHSLASHADLGALLGAAIGVAVGSGLLRLYDAQGGGHAWIRRISVRPVNRDQA
jgi:positive regulator of sigma E activity